MRRKDRQVEEIGEIIEIIKECDVCRIGLNDKEGYPYILPLNFGMDYRDGKLRLYFHSALEGKKLDLIKEDNRASFEMDTGHKVLYKEKRGYCTFLYKSVIGRGRIRLLEDDEKIQALEKLMANYHKGQKAHFNPVAIPRTLVYTLEVEEVRGKIKKK